MLLDELFNGYIDLWILKKVLTLLEIFLSVQIGVAILQVVLGGELVTLGVEHVT
jgi:hypothetical protein